DRLAEHLHRPVKFAHAIATLRDAGARLFVECGALDTLGRLVPRVVTDESSAPVACLMPGKDEIGSLQAAIQTLANRGALASPAVDPTSLLLPGIDELA